MFRLPDFRKSFFLLISALTAFYVPLIRFHEQFLNRDWSLFYSFSHFVRSCYWHYKTFPIHNPYLLGGMDMLADPQARVMSPLSLFDVLFPAPYANLLSLVFLCFLGGWGMFKLLDHLEIRSEVQYLITFLYMHSSWFALHYSEGHVIFGLFMLFTCLAYFTLRINEARYFVYLCALLAFMPLEGAMYAFIYSGLFIIAALSFGLNGLSWAALFKSVGSSIKTYLWGLIVFLFLVCGKIIPLLSIHGDREPILENIALDLKTILTAFFYPFQQILLFINGASYVEQKVGFHEIGAYVGVVSFALILYVILKHWSRKYVPYLLIFTLFLWVATGIGGQINPWNVFQKLPIINNAHIQTRAIFIPWFMLILFLSYSLNILWPKMNGVLKISLIAFLLLESLFVSQYPYMKIYEHEGSRSYSDVFETLIQHEKIDKTINNAGRWGFHHDIYKQKNTASRSFMNPAINAGEVKDNWDPNYRGEVYLLSGEGYAVIQEYTPRGLILDVNTSEHSVVQVNTNYLDNWVSDNSEVKISDDNGLLTLNVGATSGLIKLNYYPRYLLPVVLMYSLGLILLLLFVFKERVFNRIN